MKRLALLCMSVAVILGGVAGPVDAGQNDRAKESVITQVGDWFATIGKSDTDKHVILAARRAKRAAKALEKSGKKLERDFNKKSREGSGY